MPRVRSVPRIPDRHFAQPIDQDLARVVHVLEARPQISLEAR